MGRRMKKEVVGCPGGELEFRVPCEVLYLTHSLEKEQSQTTQLFVVMTVQELRVNDADTLTDI